MTTLNKSALPDLKFLLSHPSHFIALGFGVMFDDSLAAIYAIVALKVMLWSIMNYSS